MTDTAGDIRDSMRFILQNRREEEKNYELPDIHSIPTSGQVMDFAAVDGSYSFLFNRSSIWLAMIRVGVVSYGGRGSSCSIESAVPFEKLVMVSTREEVIDSMEDDVLRTMCASVTKNSGEPHREIVNNLRKYCEQRCALNAARERRNSIIALDGTLSSFSPVSKTDLMEELVSACTENGNILVGISKDSDIHSFRSFNTDEEMLRALEKGGPQYVRVPRDFEKKQKGLLHGDVYFAKLHENAGKWFRVDVGTFKGEPKQVFSNLANYANSQVCPGYPFPLLEAHRLVVAVRQFHHIYEELLLKTALELGFELSEVLDGLTHVEGRRAGAFHEFLDKMTREMK